MSYFPYKIYCDMDGVLCDFESSVVDAINKQLSSNNPKNPEIAAKVIEELGRDYIEIADIQKYSPNISNLAAEYMYLMVHDDEKYWANMPWNPGGKRLWSYIRQFNPDILTAPMNKRGKTESMSGKIIWVEKNLGIDPSKIYFEHEKWEYALSESGLPNILIDDFESKTAPFTDSGGIGILHLNANNTIRILEALKETEETS